MSASQAPGLRPTDKLRDRIAAEGYRSLDNEQDETDKNDGRDKKVSIWTRTEKQLVAIVAVCILLILTLVILLTVQHLSKPDKKAKPQCTSPSCVEVAGSVLQSMNLKADPCDDFHQYACGNWIHHQVLPPDEPRYGPFAKLGRKNERILKKMLDDPSTSFKGVPSTSLKKAKDYYAACMDTSGIEDLGVEPMLKLIEKVGPWSLSASSTVDDKWTLTSATVHAHNFGADPLFSISVSPDDMNSSVNALFVVQSGLTLSSRDYYLGNETSKYHKAFVKYFSDISVLLGAKKKSARLVAESIWELETNIASITIPPEDLIDPYALYNNMTVKQLNDSYGSEFNLKYYLTETLHRTIADDAKIIVTVPKYIKKLGELLANYTKDPAKKQVLVDYMVWHVVGSYTSYMPTRFELALLEFNKATLGIDSLPERWLRCADRTGGNFMYVTGRLFVQEVFSDKDKHKVKTVLMMIEESFKRNLPHLKWMDPITLRKALDKARNVKQKIGYPDFAQDTQQLDDYYKEVEISKDHTFQNALNLVKWSQNKAIAKWGKAPDRREWGMAAHTVNAYYSPSENTMVFPAGILQRPFYDSAFSMAMNFGGIGMVMGHELTHGFDNRGRMYDKSGNLQMWWEPSSSKAFKEREKCLVDQYTQYKVEGINVNGNTTLGENIADNGGLKTSLNAYQKWLQTHGPDEFTANLPGLNLTQTQLFFVGFAQVWCSYSTAEYAKKSLLVDSHGPAKYRVIGPVSNMPEFAEAFSCPVGSKMNPKKKCTIW